MDKRELKIDFASSNIGETKQRFTKPQNTCETTYYYQNESSRKSVLQQLPSHLARFSGQVFHKFRPKKDPVSQVIPNGRDVEKTQANYSLSIRLSKYWLLLTSAVTYLSKEINVGRMKIAGFLYSMWANKRLRWSLLLLLVIAPASKMIYLLFPVGGFGEYLINTSLITIPNFIESNYNVETGEGWYFEELYFWFLMCGELWAPLIAIFGIFLLFPKNYYPSYLVGIPFGYFLSSLVHRMYVTSYEEFHGGIGSSVVAMWLVLGVIIFMISDKILFKKNHVIRASEARMVGLINMPGMNWKDKEELLKNEANDWTKHENELYTRTG